MPTQETDESAEVEEYTPNRATRRATVKVKKSGPKRATLAALKSKAPRQKEIVLPFPSPEGEAEEVSFLFQSIGAKEWELLVSKHKPTPAQRAENAAFNTDTFPPALLARVCIDPAMSEEDWVEIWESPDWNRGEISRLYGEAVDLCMEGFNIPFNASA